MSDTPKRGRPVGSKNKPKKLTLRLSQVSAAQTLGIPLKDYAKTLAEAQRIRKKPTDWEALSKKLETALKDEIAENKRLQNEMTAVIDERNQLQKENEDNLKKLNRFVGIEHHVDHLEAEIDKHKLMVLEQRGVIGYLETKIKKLED
jgi:predicted RNase H-like nuclease (RuvC/YqgF family)